MHPHQPTPTGGRGAGPGPILGASGGPYPLGGRVRPRTIYWYGPSVSLFLEESPYMDRQSVHFWKKVLIWTVSQSISGRKSINGPSAHIFLEESPHMDRTVHIEKLLAVQDAWPPAFFSQKNFRLFYVIFLISPQNCSPGQTTMLTRFVSKF